MDAATAMIVFLSCATGGADCRELQAAHSYDNPAVCRAELPAVLQSMNKAGRHVIGRCTVVSDITVALDQITTGNRSDLMTAKGNVVVRVTRLKDGLPETTSDVSATQAIAVIGLHAAALKHPRHVSVDRSALVRRLCPGKPKRRSQKTSGHRASLVGVAHSGVRTRPLCGV